MIQLHNIMEEQVIARVKELYDQAKELNTPWLTCDCENCRMDTMNYVLNRIPPKYVAGGRGATHNAQALHDTQLKADLDALALEGMRLVSSLKRPYHNTNHTSIKDENKPAFNFPTFVGTVFDGSTFERLPNATVSLKTTDGDVKMMDASWQNPVKTYCATKGTYTFWPSPVFSDKAGEAKNFHFIIEIKKEGFVPVKYAFDVKLVSEEKTKRELNSTYSLKIQDLFLFTTDIENPMED